MVQKPLQTYVTEIVKRSTPQGGIKRIGIPTKDKPQLLNRLFRSCADEASQDPELTFIVVDQSDDVHSRSNAEIIAHYRKNNGLVIKHVTRSDQTRIAHAVTKYTGLQSNLVCDMLCGSPNEGVNTGAARNLLLLLSAGKPSMQIDDDIELSLFDMESSHANLIIHRSDAPQTVYPYTTNDSIFEGRRRQERPLSFLTNHSLDVYLQMSEHETEKANRFYQQKIIRPDTVIAMIHPGIGGDSPVVRNHFLTVEPNRDHPVFVQGGAEYNALKQSVHVLIKPDGPTLTNNNYCITACVLFPTQAQLPPFPPTKRASDSIFGLLLATAYPSYLSAHIPYSLVHRRAVQHSVPVLSFYNELMSNNLLGHILMHTPVRHDTKDRIMETGMFLLSIASESQAQFKNSMLAYTRGIFNNSIQLLEHKLHTHTWCHREWQEDIRSLLRLERELLMMEESQIEPVVDWNSLQKRYLTYAQILFSWTNVWNDCADQKISELCVDNIPNK